MSLTLLEGRISAAARDLSSCLPERQLKSHSFDKSIDKVKILCYTHLDFGARNRETGLQSNPRTTPTGS